MKEGGFYTFNCSWVWTDFWTIEDLKVVKS